MRSRAGTAIRAVSEDKEAAALMGINVNRSIVLTFALGAIMAGAGGVLYALLFRQVDFDTGVIPGLKAFTAAVLGGIGNIPGAMLGGLFLGLIESIGPTLFLDGFNVPSANQLKDVIAFTMLVLVLVFRPVRPPRRARLEDASVSVHEQTAQQPTAAPPLQRSEYVPPCSQDRRRLAGRRQGRPDRRHRRDLPLPRRDRPDLRGAPAHQRQHLARARPRSS